MTDIDRLTAALADRYTIQQEVGVGGMATVYLAEDLKHHRKVAVKVLRPELAAMLGAERFLKEIEVTANLQHPHILPLFDSGEAESFLYYVMPYVEGESLREKLDREKQLSVEESVEIAKAVANALDHAHSHEVIHRDIKPENILLQGGQPVVADFGIALALNEAGGTRLTETGFSLGTPHYMSPEQATGERELDGRTDLYSLGCVAYEMLVGRPPFDAATVQGIVAKILTDEPEGITAQRHAVPPNVDGAIHKATEKLPADRFVTGREFAAALGNPSYRRPSPFPDRGSVIKVGVASVFRRRLLWPAIVTILVAVGLLGWLRRTGETFSGFTVGLWLPASQPLAFQEANIFGPGNLLAISPDGLRIVYVGTDSTATRLYLRHANSLEPVPIRGAERAHSPFFSPDGEWIGFLTQGNPVRLMKVPTDGGPATMLVDSLNPLSFSVAGTWRLNDEIVYTNAEGGLSSISADGGTERVLTTPASNGLEFHFYPASLPGQSGLLFVVYRGGVTQATVNSQIAVLNLKTSEINLLMEGTYAAYVRTGHIVFGRSDGSVWAVPFDANSLELSGSPVPVLDRVVTGRRGNPQLTISESGNLAYVASRTAGRRRLVVVEPNGIQRVIPQEEQQFDLPRFSPDADRIAVAIRDDFGVDNVWVVDVGSGTRSRLTSEGYSDRASWSRDGTNVAFVSNRTGQPEILLKAVAGDSPAELLVTGDYQPRTTAWSPDGRWLLFTGFVEETERDIFAIPIEGDRTPEPIVQTSFQDTSPAVSPNGRWLAFVSDPSGQNEVFLQPFRAPGARVQISLDGGNSPGWAPSGNSLFYRSQMLDGMHHVRLEFTPEPRVVSREVLFDDSPYYWVPYDVSFDVDPGSGHFLMIEGGGIAETELVMVLDWVGQLLEPLATTQR